MRLCRPENENIRASRSSALGMDTSGRVEVKAGLSKFLDRSYNSIFLKSRFACLVDLPAVCILVDGFRHSWLCILLSLLFIQFGAGFMLLSNGLFCMSSRDISCGGKGGGGVGECICSLVLANG